MKRKRVFRGLVLLLTLIPSWQVALAQEEPGGGAAAQPAQPQKNPGALRKLFSIIKAEPAIRDIQRQALEFYRLEPERINALARNARLKGLMPDVSVNVGNTVGNSFQNTKDGLYPILPSPGINPNPNNFKERVSSSNDEFNWSVSARWGLDRLVFSSEALDAKSLTTIEENLVREVTTLYFSRRRVLASLILSPPNDDEDYFYELMRLDELTAQLDAFVGGNFAKKAWDWQKELVGQ